MGIRYPFYLDINYWDSRSATPVLKQARYRFLAGSIHGEDNIFDIPPTRTLDETNLIFLIGERLDKDEFLMIDLVLRFIDEGLWLFTYISLLAIVGITVSFVVFNVTMTKVSVIDPVNELIENILNPQDRDRVTKFITILRKNEFNRKFIKAATDKKKEKARIAHNKKQLVYLAKKFHKGDIEKEDYFKFRDESSVPFKYPVLVLDEVEEL